MFDDFLFRAVLAGVAVALAAGPLGCFVVWRRMAYFGDATAHAAVLGVALALAFEVSVFAGVLLAALAMATAVSALAARGHSMDTALGVLSHSALAIGLVVASFLTNVRLDLMAYLFGDILAVTKDELVIFWIGAVAVAGLIAWRWSGLLTSTLNPDLAVATGYDPKREQLVLTVALAIMVAVAIKVVGALLITALLIIPAAAARPLSRTPEIMAFAAIAIGIASTLSGLTASLFLDTPAGPSIVVAAAAVFLVSSVVTALRGV